MLKEKTQTFSQSILTLMLSQVIIKLFGIPIFIKKLNMEVISDDNT